MKTLDGDTILGWNDKGNVFLNHVLYPEYPNCRKHRKIVYVGNGTEWTLYFKHYALTNFLAVLKQNSDFKKSSVVED